MQLRKFRGRELAAVMKRVRETLGEDAMIIRTLGAPGGGVEVIAAPAPDLERFRNRLAGATASKPVTPRTVALVGPPGVGKTSAIVKLALAPVAFGGRRVGLLTLDTFRAGAVEELQTYAEIAGLELEVVYDRSEVLPALKRLRGCDVTFIDTPGRTLSPGESEPEWRTILEAIDPDETHLVLPAGLRMDVARELRERFRSLGCSHALFTKLDEVPGDAGLADLAIALDLPVRWLSDGQHIPGSLRPAEKRILGALGVSAPGPEVLLEAV